MTALERITARSVDSQDAVPIGLLIKPIMARIAAHKAWREAIEANPELALDDDLIAELVREGESIKRDAMEFLQQ